MAKLGSALAMARKNYAVKGSTITAGHANNLGAFFARAPKAEQHQVGIAEGKARRTGMAVIEDVLVEQGVQLDNGDIKIAGGFRFGVELFRRPQWSCHGFRVSFLKTKWQEPRFLLPLPGVT